MAYAVAEQSMLLSFIAYGSVSDSQFVLESAPSEYFDGLYRKIRDRFAKYVKKYGHGLSSHVPDIIAELVNQNSDDKDDLVSIFQSIKQYGEQPLNREFVLDRAEVLVRHQHSVRIIEKAASLLNNPPDVANNEKLEELFRSSNTSALRRIDVGVNLKDTEKINEALVAQLDARFPTGIKPLDAMGFCPTRKQAFLITALSGGGKTTMTRHMLQYPWWQGTEDKINVLYFSLEMELHDEVQSIYRQQGYSSAVDGIVEFDEVLFDTNKEGQADPSTLKKRKTSLKSSEDKRDKIHEGIKQRGEFFIKVLPAGVLTPSLIVATLDAIKSKHGVDIDVAGIDGFPHMRAVPASVREDETSLSHNFISVRNIARDRNMAWILNQQINREGSKQLDAGNTLRGDVIEGDKKIINHADKVLVLQQTDAERKMNLMRGYLEKGRQVAAKDMIVLSQNMAMGRAVISSGLLSKTWKSWMSDKKL